MVKKYAVQGLFSGNSLRSFIGEHPDFFLKSLKRLLSDTVTAEKESYKISLIKYTQPTRFGVVMRTFFHRYVAHVYYMKD